MAAISARVGGSKQTLYSYFKSKEELFAAAMVAAMEDRGHQVVDLLSGDTGNLRETLHRFGTAYLELIADPQITSNNRVAIGASTDTDLGARLYDLGPRRFWREVAAHLETCMEQGLLDRTSPETAARHLRGLLDAGFGEALLFGATTEVGKPEAVATALDVFFKAYKSRAEPAE